MFKRTIIFTAFAVVLLLSIGSSLAQSDDWKVRLYDDTEILTVTADGFGDSIPLPQAAQKIVQGNSAYNMALSPDERYFVFVTETQADSSLIASLQIADLQEQTCCTQVELSETWEVINLSLFSPDGKYLAMNFQNAYYADSSSAVAILNVETGKIEQTLDPFAVFNNATILMIDWREDGIEFIPSCFPCGGSPDGETMLWNPETGDITEHAGYHVSLIGSVLDNGDIIQAVQDPDYPITEADVMVGPFNVIEYLKDGDVDAAEVVYFNPDNLNLINPQWAIDGNAYLIQDQFAEGATLVWRDGDVQNLSFENPRLFLVGTPDGWLMIDTMGTHLYQYQWQNGELVESDLGEHTNLKLLSHPALGASLEEEVMPVIEKFS